MLCDIPPQRRVGGANLVPELVFQGMGRGLIHITHLPSLDHHFYAIGSSYGIL
jgi:hypothetical protein